MANNIKILRQRVRLSQQKLAELVGVSDVTMYRWEAGVREPRASELKKLCEVLHCTEAELLNGPEELRWNLKVMYSSKMPVLNIPAGKILSDLHVVDDTAMSVTLSGPFELWEDEAKFEDFVQQLRKEREIGLKVRKARQEKSI